MTMQGPVSRGDVSAETSQADQGPWSNLSHSCPPRGQKARNLVLGLSLADQVNFVWEGGLSYKIHKTHDKQFLVYVCPK